MTNKTATAIEKIADIAHRQYKTYYGVADAIIEALPSLGYVQKAEDSACGNELHKILNWNEKGHLLYCLTLDCLERRRPQGWEKKL